jgi:hypothetical protein
MAEGFAAIKNSTLCPYAKSARVRYGPRWTPVDPDDANWARNATALAGWADTARKECSHGFVLEIAGRDAASFHCVEASLKEALHSLNAHDPAASDCMKGPFDAVEWQFEFADLRLFVNVFAPCYPTNHSKHSQDSERIFLFLQPEYAFDLCGVNPANRAAKELIRTRFRAAGMPYNGELIDQRIEAQIYMFALHASDQPVRWWE